MAWVASQPSWRPVEALQHPAALAEAEEATRYYAERSSGAALSFAAELDDAISEIERAPHTFLRHVHDTHRILLRRYPFASSAPLLKERSLVNRSLIEPGLVKA